MSEHDFGSLRSLLARPSVPSWHAALRRMASWPDGREFEQVVMPYARETLGRWPEEIVRWAPALVIKRMDREDIARVQGATLIQGIDLSDKVGAHALDAMAQRGWLGAHLTHLKLSEIALGERRGDGITAHERVTLSGVRHLNLRGCRLDDRQARRWLRRLDAARVEHVDLSHNRLVGEIVAWFVSEARPERLAHLNLLGNEIDVASVSRLREAPHLAACEVLVG